MKKEIDKYKGSKKPEFFGFRISKRIARRIYQIGFIILLSTLVWIIFTIESIFASYRIYELSILFYPNAPPFDLMLWYPQIMVEIILVILALYMISRGRKGKLQMS